MFELVFLGTSASAPSIHRGLAAQVVLANEYRFLIDCGEGTQRQILKSGLGFRRLNRILLTHAHLDHILGLAGLISTFVRWEESIDFIEIYGGRSTLARVADLVFGVVLGRQQSPIPIQLVTVNAGDVILEDKNLKITAIPVVHRGPNCLGFVFEQKAHRPFLAEKAEALGIPSGPLRGQLVKGQAVTLPNGRVIQPEEVLGESIPGVRYVHIGDVGETESLHEYVQDADCLVIEATYLQNELELAQEVGHITASQAAYLAREANVKTLILSHISRRNQERAVRAEAQAIFPNTFVARDFDHFSMIRGKPVERVGRNIRDYDPDQDEEGEA
jgi:ribonuclease Z